MSLSTLILTCLVTAIVVGVIVGVVAKQRLQKKINYMLDALEDKELNFRFNEQGIRNRSFNKTLNPDFATIELDEYGEYKTIGIFKCVF